MSFKEIGRNFWSENVVSFLTNPGRRQENHLDSQVPKIVTFEEKTKGFIVNGKVVQHLAVASDKRQIWRWHWEQWDFTKVCFHFSGFDVAQSLSRVLILSRVERLRRCLQHIHWVDLRVRYFFMDATTWRRRRHTTYITTNHIKWNPLLHSKDSLRPFPSAH